MTEVIDSREVSAALNALDEIPDDTHPSMEDLVTFFNEKNGAALEEVNESGAADYEAEIRRLRQELRDQGFDNTFVEDSPGLLGLLLQFPALRLLRNDYEDDDPKLTRLGEIAERIRLEFSSSYSLWLYRRTKEFQGTDFSVTPRGEDIAPLIPQWILYKADQISNQGLEDTEPEVTMPSKQDIGGIKLVVEDTPERKFERDAWEYPDVLNMTAPASLDREMLTEILHPEDLVGKSLFVGEGAKIYLISDLIGVGALGYVFRATDTRGNPVALKVARPEMPEPVVNMAVEVAVLKHMEQYDHGNHLPRLITPQSTKWLKAQEPGNAENGEVYCAMAMEYIGPEYTPS